MFPPTASSLRLSRWPLVQPIKRANAKTLKALTARHTGKTTRHMGIPGAPPGGVCAIIPGISLRIVIALIRFRFDEAEHEFDRIAAGARGSAHDLAHHETEHRPRFGGAESFGLGPERRFEPLSEMLPERFPPLPDGRDPFRRFALCNAIHSCACPGHHLLPIRFDER